MLTKLRRFSSPFEFFVSDSALTAQQCVELENIFERDLDWHEHTDSFYDVSNCDVTEHVSSQLLQNLPARVSEITGLRLRERVCVTAQRMVPGQQVGAHSDRPLVGFECVRLVVQLNDDWAPADGGVLRIHPGEDTASTSHEFSPHRNTAFGFVMRTGSHHSVTRTHRERLSVVFNFWHVGNNEHLGTHVQSLFHEMDFSDLPPELAAVAEVADAKYSEQASYRAECVATALMRWGYPAGVVVQGYERALDRALPLAPQLSEILTESPLDQALAIVMARWAAQLYLADYDLDYWLQLVEHIPSSRVDVPNRLQDFYAAAAGDHAR